MAGYQEKCDVLWQNDECTLCHLSLPSIDSWVQHKESVSHLQKVKVKRFLDSSLFEAAEKQSDIAVLLKSAKLPFLGKECIHEFHDIIGGFSFWICTICYYACDKLASITDHLMLTSHRIPYMWRFYQENMALAGSVTDLDLDSFAHEIKGEHINSLPKIHFLRLGVTESKAMLDFEQPNGDELSQMTRPLSEASNFDENDKSESPQLDDLPSILPQPSDSPVLVPSPVPLPNTQQDLSTPLLIKATKGVKNINFLREGETYIVWCETCWQLLVFPNNGPTFDVFWLTHAATQIHEENKQKRALMPDIESKRDSFVPHLERTIKLDTRRPLNDNEYIINGWIHNQTNNQYRYAHKKTAGPLQQVGMDHIFERYTDSEDCLLPQEKDFICELCAQVLSADIDVQEHITTENHLMQFMHKEEPVQVLELLKVDSAYSRREQIRKWLENHKPFPETKVKVYNKSLNRLHKALLIHNKDDNQVEPSDLGDKEWSKSMTETYDLYQKRNIILTVVLNSGYEHLSNFPMKKTIDKCKDALIGLQYVVEICHSNSYFCRLCCAICPGVPNESQGIMAHLLSDAHRKQYLEKIESNKVFTKQLFQQPFFNTRTFAKNVEEQEKRQTINKRLVFDGECAQQLIECFPHLADSSTPKTEFLNICGTAQEVQQLPADFEEALLEVQRRSGVSLSEQDMHNLRQIAIQLGPSHWDALLETANEHNSTIVEPYNSPEQPKTVEVSMSVQSQPAEVSSPVQVQPTELSMPAQVQPIDWSMPVQDRSVQPTKWPVPVQVQPTELSMPAQVQPEEWPIPAQAVQPAEWPIPAPEVQPVKWSLPAQVQPMESVQVQPEELSMPVQVQPAEVPMEVQNQPVELSIQVQSQPAEPFMPVQIEPAVVSMPVQIHHEPEKTTMEGSSMSVNYPSVYERSKMAEVCKPVEIQPPTEKLKTVEKSKEVEIQPDEKLKTMEEAKSVVEVDAIESQKLDGIVSQLHGESAVNDKSAEPEACGNKMETTGRIYCEICRTDVVKDMISQHNEILHGENLVVTQQTGSQAQIHKGIEGIGPNLGTEKHVDHKLSETKVVAPHPFTSENEINDDTEIASSDSDVEVIYESIGNKQSHGGKPEKHSQVANRMKCSNDDTTTKSSDGNNSKSSNDKLENHLRILDQRNLRQKILSKILHSVPEPLEWDRISTEQKMLDMSPLLPGVDHVHEVCTYDFPKDSWVSYVCSLCRTFWGSICDLLVHLQSPLHCHLCKLWAINPSDNKVKYRYQYRVDPADLEIIWPNFKRFPTTIDSDPSSRLSKDLHDHGKTGSATNDGKTKKSSNDGTTSKRANDSKTLKSSNDDKFGKTSNDGKTSSGDEKKRLLRQKILENIHNSVSEPLSPGETSEAQKLLNTNSPLLPGVDEIYEVRSSDFPKCSWVTYVCSICPNFWGSNFVVLEHLHNPQHQQMCKLKKIEPIDNKIKYRSKYRVDPVNLDLLWPNFKRIPTTPDSGPTSVSKYLHDHGKTESATNDGKMKKSLNEDKTSKSTCDGETLKSSNDDKFGKISNDGKTSSGDEKKRLLRQKILENIHNSVPEPFHGKRRAEAQKLLNTNSPLLPGVDQIYEVRSCDFPECSWVSYVCSICPTWWGSNFVVLEHLHSPQHQEMCKLKKIESTDNRIKFRYQYRVDPTDLEIIWPYFKPIPKTLGLSSVSKDLRDHGKTKESSNADKLEKKSNDGKTNTGDGKKLLLRQKILENIHNSVSEPLSPGETSEAQKLLNANMPLLPGVDQIYEVRSCDFPECSWVTYVCSICPTFWGSTFVVLGHLHSPQHQEMCKLKKMEPIDNKIKCRSKYRVDPVNLELLWTNFKRIPTTPDSGPNSASKDLHDHGKTGSDANSKTKESSNEDKTSKSTSEALKSSNEDKLGNNSNDDKTNAGEGKKWLLRQKILENIHNSVPDRLSPDETSEAQKLLDTNLVLLSGVDHIYEVRSCDFPKCSWVSYVCSLCPTWWGSTFVILGHIHSPQHQQMCKLKKIEPIDNKIKCRYQYRVDPANLEMLWRNFKRIPTTSGSGPTTVSKDLHDHGKTGSATNDGKTKKNSNDGKTSKSANDSVSKDLPTTSQILPSDHGKAGSVANNGKNKESSNDGKVEEKSGDWEMVLQKNEQSLLLSRKDLLQKILLKLHNSVPEPLVQPFNPCETPLAQEELNIPLPGVDRIYEVCSSDFPKCRWRSYVCDLCHNWWGSSCAVVAHLRSPEHQEMCRFRSITPTDNMIKCRLDFPVFRQHLQKLWPDYKRCPISVDIILNDTRQCVESVPQAKTSAPTDIATNSQHNAPTVASDHGKTESGGKKTDSSKDGKTKENSGDWEMEQEEFQESLSLSRQDLLEKILFKLHKSVPEPFYSGETALAQEEANRALLLPGVDRIYEVCSSDFPTCRWRTYVCALCPKWWNFSSVVVEHLQSAKHKKACKLKGIRPTDNKIKCRLQYRVNPIHLEILWNDYKRIPTARSVIADDTHNCQDSYVPPIKSFFSPPTPANVPAEKRAPRWDQKNRSKNENTKASSETDKGDKQVPNAQVPNDSADPTGDIIVPIQEITSKTKDVVASASTNASTETLGSSQEIAPKTKDVVANASTNASTETLGSSQITQNEMVTWSEKIPSSYKAGVLPMLTIRVEKESNANSSEEKSDGEVSNGTIQSQIENIQKEINIIESRQLQLRKTKKTINTKDSEVTGDREKSAKNENSKRKPKENEKEQKLNLKAALNEVKSKETAIREKLKEKPKEEKSKKAENVKSSKATTVREKSKERGNLKNSKTSAVRKKSKERGNLKNLKQIANDSAAHENSNEEKLKETANLKKSVAKENSKGSSSENRKNMKECSNEDNAELIEIKKTNVDAKVDDKNSEELKKLKKDTINSLMFCTRSDISEDELPAIQKQLDDCQEPLVGIDQVIQVCDANYPRSDWHSYLCHLCASWIPEEQLIEHLLCENHRIVYMATNGIRIWDPASERFSNTSTLMENPQMLTTAAKQIETNSGRSSITKRSDYRLNVEILKKIWPGYQPAIANKRSIPEVSSSKLKEDTILLEVDMQPDPSGKSDKQTTEQQESQSTKPSKKVPPPKKTSKQTTSVKSKKKEPASQKLDKLLTELIQDTSNKFRKFASSEQAPPSSEKLSLVVKPKTTSQSLEKVSPLQKAQLEQSDEQSTVLQKSDNQAEKSENREFRNPSPHSNSSQRSNKNTICDRKSNLPQRRKKDSVSERKSGSPQRRRDSVSERKSNSPQKSSVSERKLNSPQRSSVSERNSNSPQRSSVSERKSNSPQRSSVSERKLNSPQRSKKYSVSERKSRSPQRRRDSVSKRKSNLPQRSKRDSISERKSRSPQSSDSERKSNSPQRRTKDSSSERKSNSPKRRKKDSCTKTKPRSPQRSRKDRISEMKSRGSRKRSPSTDEDVEILSPPPKKSTATRKLVAPLSKRLGSLNSWDSKTIDFLQEIGVTPKAAQPQTGEERQVPPTIGHSTAQSACPTISTKIPEVSTSSVPVKTTHEVPQLSQAKRQMSRKEAILSEIKMKEHQLEELRKSKELKSIPTLVNRQTQQLPELQREIEELTRKLNKTTSLNTVQPKPSATSSSGQQLRAYLGLSEDTPTDQLLVKMFIEERERKKKQQEQYSMMANLISHTLMKKKQGQKGAEDVLQLSTAFSKINPKAANVAVDIITQMSTACSSQLSDVASKVAPPVSTVASNIIPQMSPLRTASQLLAAAPGIHPQPSTAASPVNQRPEVVPQLSTGSSQIASTSSPVSSFVADDNELVRDAAMNILSDNIKGKSEDLRELLESLQKASSSSVDQISRKRHSEHEHSVEKKLRTLGDNPPQQ